MKAVEVIVGGTYWIKDDQGDLIAATWSGVGWTEVEKPSSTDGEYSYTETDGDKSIKLCFKTNVELIAFFNCRKKQ